MECEPVLSDRGVWPVKICAGALVMFTLPRLTCFFDKVSSRQTSINLFALFRF